MMETIGAFLFKNAWAIILAGVYVILHLGKLEWSGKAISDRVDRLEKKLDKDVSAVNDNVVALHSEMNDNYTAIRSTLQEIIWRLGEKSDRPK